MFTGSTILRWGLYQVFTSGTLLLRDCTKCPQVVQYCDEIVSNVYKQCNIAMRLYQVSTSSTILRESLYYLCTSGAKLRQDGIICAQVVQPWTNLPFSSTDLEIDFAKTICTFDVKIMEKSD